MHSKLIRVCIKRKPFVNLLIIAQLTAVITLMMILISTIQNRTADYRKLSGLIEKNGVIWSGYCIDTDEDSSIQSADDLKQKLVKVKDIRSIGFNSFRIRYDEERDLAVTAYTRIYDDAAAKLYTPKLYSGEWITSETENDLPQAVVTYSSDGYRTGDTVELKIEGRPVKIYIIGVISDGENYLGTDFSHSLREPNYKLMLSKHFDRFRDTFRDSGSTEEEIDMLMTDQGYDPKEDVKNPPEFFMTRKEWNKLGAASKMADLMAVTFEDDISDIEMLQNRRIINDIEVQTYAIPFSTINENSLRDVYHDVYTMLPIIAGVFLLSLAGIISLNAVICRMLLRSCAIFWMGGARKLEGIRISVKYNALVYTIALVLSSIILCILSLGSIIDGFTVSILQLAVIAALALIILLISFTESSCIFTKRSLQKAAITPEEQL